MSKHRTVILKSPFRVKPLQIPYLTVMETVSRIPTKRRHWSVEEDEAIRRILSEISVLNWSDIARTLETQFTLPGRSGKQCRERWYNHLDPSLSKGLWTVEEQLILFHAHLSAGNTWAGITPLLPGRSENAIKNQFYSCLRRQFRKWKGSEPTRYQMKKHDHILSSQILVGLNKKAKHRSIHEQHNEDLQNTLSIENLHPIDRVHSEDSTVLSELDFILPFGLE